MSSVMPQAAIDAATTAESRPLSQSREDAPRVPWKPMLMVAGVITIALFLIKWYQHTYSWSAGLDAWSPEFQIFWMTVFYTEIIVLPVVGAVWLAYLWFTREREIQKLPARQELSRFYAMFAFLSASALVITAAIGLLTEADAAWHQVVIRDTDFTPTHIFLFYLGVPAILVILSVAWMWVHTRLPYFANRISVPLSVAIVGFVMVGPVVAFNEWAHTFFYAEELFAAPVHWFFVLFGFSLVFIGGFAVQCIQRMAQLTRKLSLNEVEAEMRR